ncbi:phospholipase C, phosphocholine-specific [Gluconacetobacter azotocaptans]|uniref:phospholipase C n=1 Tax=Gluconacetobacter azotocaptans TaxID=142834 RepID=A0A7W4JUD8_9PROT|nr:phospholipase C, phosphocholine-specific [Gluconacetobacter azotocaptans]MBB2191033.1 phospholipase C, phosphocholine-specific [Gluconacetobacter azotocaptans]GBQ31381.1 phospholipase C [Gluconacetobacter azotocaptans DSM 13594]
MFRSNRRDFLQMGAMSAGLFPAAIRRAMALPAHRRAGTIEDVQHIVVFMQENRSFDHYFGHMSGVRGVNDRFPVLRADGVPMWRQARGKGEAGEIVPFRLNTKSSGAECVMDLDHSWDPTHAAINAGRNDQWPKHKTDMTMGYYTRQDLPFHYALADAFTVCDHYFCSTPCQTHPNRFYLMTGTVDPTGVGGGPILDNIDWVDRKFYKTVPPPFTWTTFPERLEQAGVSWQVYQEGLEVTDLLNGNFGTNVLMNFRNFVTAPEGSALRRRAMTRRTLDDLKADVTADRLPSVSWLLPPAVFSEHPRWSPGYGAVYISRVLDALTSNPDVWARTVFLVMYDENDGYFDHVPPPQPPTPALPGKSTVHAAGEIHDRVPDLNTGRYTADNLPYGLGPRVPMMAISPWSTGGYVCSEVFDHTSVIRFIERRFGVNEPNITPWRRAVCGDLTSAFDFSLPVHRRADLPDTSGYRAAVDASCHLPDPAISPTSRFADIGRQEEGTRPARPLPYDLAVEESTGANGALALRFVNTGQAAACLYVYRELSDETPRRYTVEPGRNLDDIWLPDGEAPLILTVMGPNGFIRRYHREGRPDVGTAGVIASVRHDGARDVLHLALKSDGDAVHVVVRDNAYGRTEMAIDVPAHETVDRRIALSASANWYDFTVLTEGGRNTTRFAGHVENGRTSTTDPAMHAPVLDPPLREYSPA